MQVDVIVVGGGLSGLTTAYYLNKAGVRLKVLERETVVGGCIKTTQQDGYMLEHGPNSMMVNRQQVLNFLEELNLGDQIENANSDAAKRFIVKGGALHALPGSPWGFIRTPLFSAGDKLRLFREPFIGKGSADESIAQFVRRRLGNGFYEYAINPFVSGVYAGDPEQLLARAAVRKVWALEEKHGSLVGGAIAMMTGRDKPEGRIKGRLLSFRDGMGALPKTIASALGDKVQTGIAVDRLERTESGWTVFAGDQQWQARHVVLGTPTRVTANLLRDLSPETTQPLEEIPYAPVAVVHLGVAKNQVKHPLDGFGALIPRKEGVTTLGTLFSSTLFGGRADDILLTCFIGGATLPEIRGWDDDKVREQVVQDLRPLIGLSGDPTFANVVRWQEAIPQYTHGHFERIDRVAAALEKLGQISVRANWRDGISLPDCILNSIQHAQDLSRSLA